MAVTYIHTCYRILDPEKSKDFYVNKVGRKKLGEMDLSSATNHFFAMEGDASSPMLELTHNHDRTEPYHKGDGYAHVAFTVDDLESTVASLKEQGVTVTLEPQDAHRRQARLQDRLHRGPRRLQDRTRPARHDESGDPDPIAR
jgi:lactoylglutathione lyase